MSNPQYGNSIRVGSLRIGGWLPVRSFVIGLGTVVATMMIILLGYLIPGLVFLLGMFLGLAIFGIPFGDADLTLAARILRSLRHARHVSTGEATFVNSHFSGRTSEELLGLPGYLHTINTVNSIDGTGAPVQLLHHKSVGMASVTLACAPIGTNMQPQDSTTHQVGSFANWLGSLACAVHPSRWIPSLSLPCPWPRPLWTRWMRAHHRWRSKSFVKPPQRFLHVCQKLLLMSHWVGASHP